VVAKPEPYKLKPAPPLDDYDLGAYDDLRDPLSYSPTPSTTARPPAIRVTEPTPLTTKISLKDYLKANGKFSLQKPTKAASTKARKKGQQKQPSQRKPKTKYDTDQVIYPTTTYRPQTFEPTSSIAQNFALAFNSKLRSKAKKAKTTPLTTERPYGTKKSSKKGRNGRLRKLKKVRRKKVFFDNLRKSNKKRQEQLRAAKKAADKARKVAAEKAKKESRSKKDFSDFKYTPSSKSFRDAAFQTSAKVTKVNKVSSKVSKNNDDLFFDVGGLEAKEERKRNPLHQPVLAVNVVKPTSSYRAPADYYAGPSDDFHAQHFGYVAPGPASPVPPVAYGAEEVLDHRQVKTLSSPYEYEPPNFAAVVPHNNPHLHHTKKPHHPVHHTKKPHHHIHHTKKAYVTPAPPPKPTYVPAEPVAHIAPAVPVVHAAPAVPAVPLTHVTPAVPVAHAASVVHPKVFPTPDPYLEPAPYTTDSYHEDDGYYEYEPKPYSFTYGVKDDYSGNDFSRIEERTGAVTKGSYKVALPDGRIQIVNYVADENGYKASVTYEGEPSYPAPSKYNHPPPLEPHPPLSQPPPLPVKTFRHSKKVETYAAPAEPAYAYVEPIDNEVYHSPPPPPPPQPTLRYHRPTPAPSTLHTTTYAPTPLYGHSKFLQHALKPLARAKKSSKKAAGKKAKKSHPSDSKASAAKAYPNFKPVYQYPDKKAASAKANNAKATTARSVEQQLVTTTYFPATTSLSYQNYHPTTPLPPKASPTTTARSPTTTARSPTPKRSSTSSPRLYVTSPKPTAFAGPYRQQPSTKITTYRPKYKTLKRENNEVKVQGSSPGKGSNYQDDLDYYDYYYEAALDYIQGRINQLNQA